ncbi:gem-associated protein 6-like [Panonychus citri]|uniref:gem-associated protein 6-like n=1 Tax=Panonychus citri TaxID=50023 RepID=UPI00230732A4|nr:gem-associated protein 6-like [Panonychus citri]
MEIIEGNCFKDNFPLWIKLVNKKITVTTDNGNDYQGIVKTIDPLTGSIVLLQFNDEELSKPSDLMIITGHAVKRLTLQTDQQPQSSTINLDIIKENEIDQDELKGRKIKLIEWFEKNRIPVEENDNQELVVAKSITIKSPYTKDDCNSSNVMVVRRIQDLMSRMPTTTT